MTATFGKLEHETLTLEPGLNIIQAPNEWGKSTWCAFLVAMLYGIDTRAKTTKAALAEKERYAPWSGSPMSGSIDLNWNGRDITIQRRTKGRSIMGEFRAFETETGIEIPELTAANCGQMLLGVERSVFTRAGFLKFTDLPVTQDESLRHRLNALVTTGDESGAAEALGQTLRELKNRCRYNRSGLLPQAEAQRAQLESRLQEQQSISDQSKRLHQRQADIEEHIARLENHKAALRYAAAKDDEKQVQAALDARDEAIRRQQELESLCQSLPSREEAAQAAQELTQLRRGWDSIQMEEQMLPSLPTAPEPPEVFRGCRPEDAVAQAESDRAEMQSLKPPKNNIAPLLWGIGAAALVAGIVLLLLKQLWFSIPVLCIGAGLLTVGLFLRQKHKSQLAKIHMRQTALCRRYGSNDLNEWVAAARNYESGWNDYQRQIVACRKLRGDLDSRKAALLQKITVLSGSQSIGESLEHWNRVQAHWDELADSRRSLLQAEKHLQALQSMAKIATAPTAEDDLTFTEAETNRLLSDATYELRQLHQRLGQCQGQMDALGSNTALQKELDAVNHRIGELELTYTALDYAQKALAEASAELQRRFAPRISKRAQELFSQLTDGRYDRLTLAEDLSMHAGAQGEDTLRSQQWRSDGTIDQLYLALRLAVAQELTPDAPLILDDALVRFDDDRLAAALGILKQESNTKQVILFTCQSREKEHS